MRSIGTARSLLTKTFPATYVANVAIMSPIASHMSTYPTRKSLSCFSVVGGTAQDYAVVSQRSMDVASVTKRHFPGITGNLVINASGTAAGPTQQADTRQQDGGTKQIGRASCRERV